MINVLNKRNLKRFMIITITGSLGAGKSTVAKELAEHFNLKRYSTGDFWREVAKEMGINVIELNKVAEKDPSIDKKMDKRQELLGKTEDDFVIDSRLGWHFIPNSIKIFLKVSKEEGARRIFSEQRDDEKINTDLQKTIENIKMRRNLEKKRYMGKYGLDYFDESHYDLVLDTSELTIREVVEKIINFIGK